MKKYIFTIFLLSLFCVSQFGQNTSSNCPSISITLPAAPVAPGENLVFAISYANKPNGSGLEYSWIVNNGVIIEGQGTESITVNTSGLSDSVVTTILSVSGLSSNCRSVFKGKGKVFPGTPPCHNFGFGDLPRKNILARIDGAIEKLLGVPGAQLYVVNYGNETEIADRKTLIRQQFKKRNLDPMRVVFLVGGEKDAILTRLWLVSEDGKALGCEAKPKPVVCPSISVSAPAVAMAHGENQSFTANVNRLDDDSKIGYVWTVNRGKIINGQGTSTIAVSTKNIGDSTVTAFVTVSGLPKECENSASGSGIPFCPPKPILVDEFGLISPGMFENSLNAYVAGLINDRNAKGYVISFGLAQEVRKREKRIRDSLGNYRGFVKSRVVFMNGGVENNIRTRLWIVPAGADSSVVH